MKSVIAIVCRYMTLKSLLVAAALTILLIFCFIAYIYNHHFSAFVATLPDIIVEKRTWNNCDNDISTTKDMSYVLYGEGSADEETKKHLHSYIRSLTSRQAPGGVHLSNRSGRQHFSQIGASQFVDRLLKRRRHGVFIECGAANGEYLSNSLFFELHRNWTGVLIEGNPEYYRSLLSKNRNAYVVRACLSTIPKPQTVSYRLRNLYSGISNSPSGRSINVHCFPLNEITAALGIQHVDYLSLDVEGLESNILSTIDWSQLTIDVMTVEYNMRVHKLSKLRSLLTANGSFTEVARLPFGRGPRSGQDVVFMHAVK